MKINKQMVIGGAVALIALVIVSFMSSTDGYRRGYAKGQADYKDENYLYYSAWNATENNPNHFSEHLFYQSGADFNSARIDRDFYSLSWNNFLLSSEGFEVYCLTPERNDSRCELRIVNNQCVRDTDPLDVNYNCSRTIVYRPEGGSE